MVNFTVNVTADDGERRVPVGLAGQIMVDIQQILADIGEYLVAKELRIQDTIHPDLLSRFVLFLNANGGMSLNSSVNDPLTSGFGNIIDDAIALMEATLDALGSGVGGYWMEDNYADPIYRNRVIYDVTALSQHINGTKGYTLTYGPAEAPKKFGEVNIEKLATFIKDRGFVANGATLGLIMSTPSRSKGNFVSMQCGKNHVRLAFLDRDEERVARNMIGKGPAIVGGKMIFQKDGSLIEIRDAASITPVSSIKFRRMISCDGDVALSKSVVANVSYASGVWTLKNDTLGITAAKDTWDEAVQSFHDYFIFIWTQYYGKDEASLSDEEKDIMTYLDTLVINE